MVNGPTVELHQLLDSRAHRSMKQKEWVQAHSLPVVSFTINMVGSIKKNHIAKLAFDAGYQAIVNACIEQKMALVELDSLELDTGYELMLCVATSDILRLKTMMMEIENHHSYGRLFDIDVIGLDGIPLTRIEFNAPPRTCLVCHRSAKGCARSRRHPISEIIQKMSEIVNDSK